MSTRLAPEIFDLPVEKVRNGYYAAVYFNRTKQIVESDPALNKIVTMQVFQRNDGAVVCGADEAIAILKVGAGYYDTDGTWIPKWDDLEVRAKHDGDTAHAWEPVLTITGEYGAFAHLESLYLGALARGTKVATNIRRCVKAAKAYDRNTGERIEKPVLFFADRFDYFGTQERDGYAATVGGATGVATDAHGAWVGQAGMGTMPHALIAVCDRKVSIAGQHFMREFPDVPLVGLVDFNNDCVGDTLALLDVAGDKLHAVRLDTSGNMVDESLQKHRTGEIPKAEDYGVNPKLIRNVRAALDTNDGKHVKIIVSGGFNPDKIRYVLSRPESYSPHEDGTAWWPGSAIAATPDGFGVGSSSLKGDFDYTADIVVPEAKNGRWERDASDLELVD